MISNGDMTVPIPFKPNSPPYIRIQMHVPLIENGRTIVGHWDYWDGLQPSQRLAVEQLLDPTYRRIRK